MKKSTIMCGIAGILSFTKQIEKESLLKMINSLVHRGPDGEGIWLDNEEKIGLGHRRLSILDLTSLGSQPMKFADERYCITYNGEIYNYIELKKSLEEQGYIFKSNSDTEVLLALFDLKKEKALSDLDGMFAFAIWDAKEKRLFCARDRFGEKPFYYYHDKNFFAFASEIKPLFEIGVSNEKNFKKIYNFLQYSIIEDPYAPESTFYNKVFQLEPSHYFYINVDGAITKKKYWDIDVQKRTTLVGSEAIEEFTSLFIESVSTRLRSDVPVGSSLSGGLDSSSIVMLIDKIKERGHVQKTFSARFENFERDEGVYMNKVIENSNVEPYFVFPSEKSVMDNFKTIVSHQEEPFGSASIAIQYEVMKLAKENGAKVLMDGQGADELLGGYKIFWNTYFNQLYRTKRKKFKDASDTYYTLHNALPYKNDLSFKWKSFHSRSFERTSDFLRTTKQTKSDYFAGIHPDLVSAFRNAPNPIFKTSNLKEHLYFYLMKRGLNELLRFADRNAMANSIEVRLPFLSHKLVEFVFTLPEEMLLCNGWTKYILRKSMENILPIEITWRKDKIGFEPPQEKWLKHTFFKDILKESENRLKKEKIIIASFTKLNWNYISLNAFLDR